ncbi:MAG: major capsid protein P2 [Candidatus Reddybacter sp.]
MGLPLRKLSQFPSVAASSVSTLSLDELRGNSIHGIILEQGGTTFTKAHMTEIKLSVGGKSIIHGITGAQLQDLNDYDGLSATADYVGIWFGDPTARTIFGQHLTDLDLSYYDQASAVLEVTIGGATAPTLQAYAILGPPKAAMGLQYSEADVAMTRALIRTVATPSAAVSKQSYSIGLGSSAGAAVRKIGMFHTNLTSVEYKKNGIAIHDDVSAALNNYLQAEFARVPQSGLYVLDHIVDANQGGADQTIDSRGRPFPMQVNLTTSASDTITVFADVRAALQLL